MERTDLFLLVLIGLSVLMGQIRGLTEEILRLAAYILSGVFGCLLVPVFQPVFSAIPEEAVQRSLALFSGTVVVWFALKIATSVLKQKVRESRFQKLDKSLGGIFGGVRICAVLFALNFIFEILSPHLVESSKILTLSGVGTSYFFDAFPEFENFKPKKIKTAEAQEWDWKKRLLHYLQNTTLGEGEEKTTLLSYIAVKAVKGAPEEKTELSDLEGSPETNRISPQMFETRIVSILSGETIEPPQNDEEILGVVRKNLLQESQSLEEKGDSK